MAETIAKEKDTLVQEIPQAVSSGADFVASAAASGGDVAQAMGEELAQTLQEWRARIAELEQQARRRARAAAHDTDEYVHANPWQAVGIAAAVGALAGLTLGLLTRGSR